MPGLAASAGSHELLSAREAARILAVHDGRGDLGPLGQPVLAVDLTDRPEALRGAVGSLRRIPAVTIGTGSAGAADPAVAAAFDVLLTTQEGRAPWAEPCAPLEQELNLLVERVRSRPLSSVSLVQLLRAVERLDVYDGLVVESAVYSMLQAGPEFSEWLAARPSPKERLETGPPLVAANEDGTLHLTLNRPSVRNAYNTAMRDALSEALEVAAADRSIKGVLIDAEGPAFCSGGDLYEFGSLPDPATAHAVRTTRSVGALLAECSSRVTVLVHGGCVGAGVELPAFAGRVVARDDSTFSLPELAMGLVPGAGGTVSVPRRIGRQRTAYLALSGHSLDAATALEWGLVDELA